MDAGNKSLLARSPFAQKIVVFEIEYATRNGTAPPFKATPASPESNVHPVATRMSFSMFASIACVSVPLSELPKIFG